MAKYIDMAQEDLINIFKVGSYDKSVELNVYNKELYNGFLLADNVREVVNMLDYCGYNILGFCDAPYVVHENFDKAIILEDYTDDYQIRWCHVPDYLIFKWQCELNGTNYEDFIINLYEGN